MITIQGEAKNVAKRKKNQVLDTVITVSQNEIKQNYIIQFIQVNLTLRQSLSKLT